MNTLVCQDCKDNFTAKRSDALRCKGCINDRRKLWQKTPQTKAMRSSALRKVREAAIARYGGACVCCRENIYEFLAIDHVNGGGRQEREKMSTSQIVRKVISENWPDTYQVLCHNCNQAKGWYGDCPHERRTT